MTIYGGRSFIWSGGDVPVSRLVMEAYLGRPLESGEVVHHKDGNTLNDDIENLQVMTRSEHSRLSSLGNSNTLGKHHSEETKEKISQGNLGKSRNLGKVCSDETKEKLRQSANKAWERRRR